MIFNLLKNLFVVFSSIDLINSNYSIDFSKLVLFRNSKKGNVNMIVTLMILVALMVIIFLLINNWDALAGSLVSDGEDLVMEGIL